MNTNPAYDLFLLMFNLTQLHNKEKIIELFIERMMEIFKPVVFNYSLNAEQNRNTVFELRTRKSHYGVIVTDRPLPDDKVLSMLIKNSTQMLAVTFEHLDYEHALENERNAYEAKASTSLGELKKTVQELQDSQTASINLIEDLSDEVEKRSETEKELLLKNLVFDESIAANSIADINGVIKQVNASFLKTWGYLSEKEVLGRPISDFLKYENEVAEIIKSLDVTGQWNGEYTALKSDRSTFFANGLATVIRNKNGELIGYQSSVQDVSDRKKTEEALRESEDKFKYIFDHSVIGKSITLPAGKISVNKAFCDMLGYRRDELEKTRWQDISHSDDIDFTQKIVNSLLAGEKDSARFVKRYIHKNGSIVWADIGTAVRRDAEGTPLYFLTAITDITELKRVEDELRLQSEIMSHMAEAVYLVRMDDGIIVYTNSKFEELFGYAQGEMTGKHVSIVNAPGEKSPRETASEILDRLDKDGFWKGEVKNIRKDGSSFWSYASVTIFDHSQFGKVLVSVQRDITDRKIAEAQIKQLNEELEQRVIQRTEQLQAANKELEAFSFSVSHDLRAPLRAIHSFTSILSQDYEKILGEEGNRICKIIETSSVHMGQLIDDLLAFSRVGRTGLEHVSIDMGLLVKNVYSELTIPEEQKRITFTVGKLPSASGDPVLIRQVFTNLLSNALKYSSKKEYARISVGSKSGKDETVFYVKDNGVGFDMLYSKKLFGVFQRLHSVKEFDGNGVGLAIVQRIILRHEGRVWAEGKKGKGATFYFTLPVKRQVV
jgi:PAS domain S-box-containing protein